MYNNEIINLQLISEIVMSTIVVVISGFRMGHLTRQLALIDAILSNTIDIKIKIVCAQEHIDILKHQHLDDRISIFLMPGLYPSICMENQTKIDIGSSIYSYQMSLDFDTQVRDDTEWGRILFKADLVINDIESVHNEIVKKMNIKLINISNFTWSDILDGIGAKEIAEALSKQINLADDHYTLPFTAECMGFNNPISLGFISRKVDSNFVEAMKTNYNGKKFVFLDNLGENIIENFDEFIKQLHSRDLVPIFHEQYVLKLSEPRQMLTYKTRSTDTHNLVALSDIAITKTGYSTITEAYMGGSFILYWIRDTNEDRAISDKILDDNMGIKFDYSIEVNELLDLIDETLKYISDNPVKQYNNETDGIAKMLIDKYLR